MEETKGKPPVAKAPVKEEKKPPVKLRAVQAITVGPDEPVAEGTLLVGKTIAPGELFEIDAAEGARLVKIGAAVVSPALTGE